MNPVHKRLTKTPGPTPWEEAVHPHQRPGCYGNASPSTLPAPGSGQHSSVGSCRAERQCCWKARLVKHSPKMSWKSQPSDLYLKTPPRIQPSAQLKTSKVFKIPCSSPPSAGATSCSFPLAKAFSTSQISLSVSKRILCKLSPFSLHFPSVPCWSPLHSFPFNVYVWGSTSYNQVRSTVSHASSADTSTLAYFNSCHDATTHEGAKVGGSMMYDGGSCWILWNPTFNSQNAHTRDRWLLGHITTQEGSLGPCWPMLTHWHLCGPFQLRANRSTSGICFW